tara:strand:- start:67 stop:441 length:375 start_codon:yes stop_codon:yes gene_type:complete
MSKSKKESIAKAKKHWEESLVVYEKLVKGLSVDEQSAVGTIHSHDKENYAQEQCIVFTKWLQNRDFKDSDEDSERLLQTLKAPKKLDMGLIHDYYMQFRGLQHDAFIKNMKEKQEKTDVADADE